MALTPGDGLPANRTRWHGRMKTTGRDPFDTYIYKVSALPGSRSRPGRIDRANTRKRASGRRRGLEVRRGCPIPFGAAAVFARGSPCGLGADHSPACRCPRAGPDRPGSRVCRAVGESGWAGESVAVGPCMDRQAVVVCLPEGVTCEGAGRAETRSPANRERDAPGDGWRYVRGRSRNIRSSDNESAVWTPRRSRFTLC